MIHAVQIIYSPKVYCTNIEDLIPRIVVERGLSADTTDVHIGMDGGQGWLKLGLILTDRSKEERDGRARYSEVYDKKKLGKCQLLKK